MIDYSNELTQVIYLGHFKILILILNCFHDGIVSIWRLGVYIFTLRTQTLITWKMRQVKMHHETKNFHGQPHIRVSLKLSFFISIYPFFPSANLSFSNSASTCAVHFLLHLYPLSGVGFWTKNWPRGWGFRVFTKVIGTKTTEYIHLPAFF